MPAEIDPGPSRQQLAVVHERVRHALVPPTEEQIVRGLTTLAEMLQCSLPEEDGMTLYVALLSELSYPAVRHAMIEVAKTHPWPRLPLPVEIRTAAAAVQAELEFWNGQLSGAIALLSKGETHE